MKAAVIVFPGSNCDRDVEVALAAAMGKPPHAVYALHGLGFDEAGDVRQGKFIEIELDEKDAAKAKARAEEMCKKLLANPVIEDYAVEVG